MRKVFNTGDLFLRSNDGVKQRRDFTANQGYHASVIPLDTGVFTSNDMSFFTDHVYAMEVSGIDSGLWQRLPGIKNEDICRLMLESFQAMLHPGASGKFVFEAAKTIMQTSGRIAMHQLGEQLNCSTRHLQKVFKKHIGLSPSNWRVFLN